jgi:hypothetical protein
MGALHPVLFFLVVYGISLFLAIFVCRTVYYSINTDMAKTSRSVKIHEYPVPALGATALK